jgi:hypothetical protein
MPRVNASALPAQMVELEPFGDRPDQFLIDDAMRPNELSRRPDPQ